MKALPFLERNVKFGMDAILGLVPGGGDLVSGIFSLYMLRTAMKMNLAKARYSFNVS